MFCSRALRWYQLSNSARANFNVDDTGMVEYKRMKREYQELALKDLMNRAISQAGREGIEEESEPMSAVPEQSAVGGTVSSR